MPGIYQRGEGRLIAGLAGVGGISPAGDGEAQFQEQYRFREGCGLGETHYKAGLNAARIRNRWAGPWVWSRQNAQRTWAG